MSTLYAFISGAIMCGSCVGAAFFLKFWRRTRDSLFLMFSLAFWLLGIERIAHAALYHYAGEDHVAIYAIRFVAFALIAVAIINKNRSERR